MIVMSNKISNFRAQQLLPTPPIAELQQPSRCCYLLTQTTTTHLHTAMCFLFALFVGKETLAWTRVCFYFSDSTNSGDTNMYMGMKPGMGPMGPGVSPSFFASQQSWVRISKKLCVCSSSAVPAKTWPVLFLFQFPMGGPDGPMGPMGPEGMPPVMNGMNGKRTALFCHHAKHLRTRDQVNGKH